MNGTRKPTDRLEKLSPQFKRRIVRKVKKKKKKKTSSTSKLWKSCVDAPCSSKTIRMHLNDKKIKDKKIINRPNLNMNLKEKKWIMRINIKS